MVANVQREPTELKTDRNKSRGLGLENSLVAEGVVDDV